MTSPGFPTFDTAFQEANELLSAIETELSLPDHQHAYHALRSVLQTLRDRIPINESVKFSAQLPMLVRGFYFEGWNPAEVPVKMNKEEFLAAIAKRYPLPLPLNPQEIAQGVWQVLENRLSPVEMANIRQILPQDLQQLLV